MRSIYDFYNRCYDAVNYRLPRFAGGRFASYCRPTTITFLLTDKCNARCVHCDIWKNAGPDDNPSLEQLKTCLRDLRRWLGPVKVTFSGGEALIKPYTPELLQYAINLGLPVELLTNGFWADQSRIERVALMNPWRITVSFDGLGRTHDKIRGHEGFYSKTSTTVQTLYTLKRQHALDFTILLKTVVMEHNLDDLAGIARFAGEHGLEVRYQPIEQNYNTVEDLDWFVTSLNWPRDISKATAAVADLIQLKKQGLPIANSFQDFNTMIRYFERPAELLLAVQSHLPPDQPMVCAATGHLQIEPNGDVKICARRPAVGNIKDLPIRQIWQNRPHYWQECCCRPNKDSSTDPSAGTLTTC